MTTLLILVLATLAALAAYTVWRVPILALWKRLLAVSVCSWRGHRRLAVRQGEHGYRSECRVCERPIMKIDRGDPWIIDDRKASKR